MTRAFHIAVQLAKKHPKRLRYDIVQCQLSLYEHPMLLNELQRIH